MPSKILISDKVDAEQNVISVSLGIIYLSVSVF